MRSQNLMCHSKYNRFNKKASIMSSFFLTALSLAPTTEKELVDIQRNIFSLYKCPSALALPPVLPLFSSKNKPQEKIIKNILHLDCSPFSFQRYGLHNSILCAAIDISIQLPVPEENEIKTPLEQLPGFYLADFSASSGLPREKQLQIQNLPQLPDSAVRTLRLLVIELNISSDSSWWKETKWIVCFEDWIKLRR